MATRQNLIDTYNANPTLQARYTLPQYLALFDFSKTTTTPTQTPATAGIPNIINQNLRQGQGDDGPKGNFGIFGDLDKSTAKEFNVEVYDEELGDFIPTTITGYQNVKSGLYQDKFGKNLQPMFSNKGQAFGLFGLAAQAIGGKPDTVGGYVPGSIRGKYDNFSDIFRQKQIRTQQSIQQELAKKAMQEKIRQEEAAERARQNAVTYQYNNPSQPGSGSPDDRSDAFRGGGANVPQADYTSTGRVGFGYGLADGGRVGLENGGFPTFSEEDFSFMVKPEGGRPKPSLDYYDDSQESPGDEYPIITIPMGKMKKPKKKKKKEKKFADGGRVYLYNRLK